MIRRRRDDGCIWRGDFVHSASCYFGQTVDDGRLFQMFFFDEEKTP